MSISPLVSNSLYRNIVKACSADSDFTVKKLLIGGKFEAALLFLDGCVDSASLSEQVVKPLCGKIFENADESVLPDMIMGRNFSLTVQRCSDAEKIMQKLSFGNAALIVGRLREAFVFEARPKTFRAVGEPSSENITKGAKDCFTEQSKVNVSLIRNRLTNPNLRAESVTVGRQSATTVYLVSIDGIVNPDCLEDARRRISSLDVDCVSSLGVIEEALKEGDCIFPQVLVTERPDRVCAHINEGCVAVITDGFPFVLLAPVSILHHLSTAEDYSRHHISASVIRVMRYILLIIAFVLPGFYISVATYHQEMLPSQLAASIMRTRLSVPFNDLIEVLILLIAFEILSEAGLRMPQNIGQTVSIVGGLIVGDAAVNAKLISPVVIIIVALSVIATYTIPDQDLSNAVRICRFILCLICSVFGLVGLSLGGAAVLVYMCASRSLGVPYMAPLSATSPSTMDTFRRRRFSDDVQRPQFLGVQNKIRRNGGSDS